MCSKLKCNKRLFRSHRTPKTQLYWSSGPTLRSSLGLHVRAYTTSGVPPPPDNIGTPTVVSGTPPVDVAIPLDLPTSATEALTQGMELPQASGFSLTGLVGDLMQWMQVEYGITAWVGTAVIAVWLRIVLFPIVVSMRRDGLYLAKAKPVIEVFQGQLKMIRDSGVVLSAAQMQELTASRDAELSKIHPGLKLWHPWVGILPLSAAQIFFFLGLRKYFTGPTATGSFCWIPDLAKADPFGVMPVVFAVIMAVQLGLTIRSNSSGINGEPNAIMLQAMRFGMFVIPPVVACTMALFPSGLVLYFSFNASCILLQTLLLDMSSVRRALGIPILNETPSTASLKSTNTTETTPADTNH
jgi:membrane protein insertase Oxa1/YidC/SpoIIIJ